MSGFVGFTNYSKDAKFILENMQTQIAHRGPDDTGSYIDEDIAVGVNRLAIIDVIGGSQPIFNEDKTKILVYDGSILNYRDLRWELARKGHNFSTNCDGEVLLHGYEEFGEKFLPKIRGNFAFVVWDKRTKILFGARDRFGVKPLYIGQMEDVFMFSSEIKAFLPHPKFKKQINTEALASYLNMGFNILYDTFFEGVKKVGAGHFFYHKNGVTTTTRYYDMKFMPDISKTSEQISKRFEECMEDVLSYSMVSDTPVGFYVGETPEDALFINKGEPKYVFSGDFYKVSDEFEEVASKNDVINVHTDVTEKEYMRSLPEIMYSLDEPVLTYQAPFLKGGINVASNSVKTIISSVGADEIFAGKEEYKQGIFINDEMPRPVKRIMKNMSKIIPKGMTARKEMERSFSDLNEWYGINRVFSTKEITKVLKVHTEGDYLKTINFMHNKAKGFENVSKMQYVDILCGLINGKLPLYSKIASSFGLEIKTPYLDNLIVNFACEIPSDKLIDAKQTKKIFGNINYEKTDYEQLVCKWLKDINYYETIKMAINSEACQKFLNVNELMKTWEDFRNNKNNDYRKIWAVYLFSLWYDEYFIKR